MRLKVRIEALILSAVCAVTCAVPVSAAGRGEKQPEVIASEAFDTQVTNSIDVSGITVTEASAQIVQTSADNKALKVGASDAAALIQKPFTGALGETYVMSFKIKPEFDAELNVNIGLMASYTKYKFLKIEKNVIKTLDNKIVGGVNPYKFTDISIVFNTKAKMIDVYTDGRAVIENWKVSSWATKFTSMYFEKSLSGEMYLDDIALQNADEPHEITKETFNPEIVDNLHIDENVGDYTYFRTRSQANTSGTYFKTSLYQKTNEIISERADYKNPNKGECIIFNKSTSDDVYMDITTKSKIKMFEDGRHYKYYYMATDFWCSNAQLLAQMFFIRDNSSGASTQNAVIATIKNSSIVTADNKTINNIIVPETWMNYKAIVDISSHTADIYINNKLIAENVKFNENIKQLDVVRFSLDYASGAGTMKLKDTEITGLVKKPDGTEITHTDVFTDDEPIKEYLSDKVSFHHYGQRLYKDGAKSVLSEKTIYENGELYVSADDFNAAFGTAYTCTADGTIMNGDTPISTEHKVKFQNGKPMLPSKEIAERYLNKYITDDTYGMVIFSDTKMYWDIEKEVPHYKEAYQEGKFTSLSPLQHMNSFLFFDRPTVEQLKEKLNVTSDDGKMHPRIYGNREDFDRVKETAKTDGYMQSMVDSMIKTADSYIGNKLTVYEFEDNYRQYNKANLFQKMMQYFGFAYLMTGDKKYADAAWKHCESVCGFPDFNENHAIDAGLYMTGLALAYDWCYDAFTPEQRKLMEDSVLKNGIGVMDRAFYIGLPSSATASTMETSTQITPFFTKWKSNYNTHVNAGIIIASIAFAEADTDLCFSTLGHALKSLEYTMYGFVPEGSWVESNDYWGVTVECMVKIMSALENSFDTDFNFGNYQGFENTCRFYASMGSSNGMLAWADGTADSSGVSHQVFSYFAKRYNQKDIAQLRRYNIEGSYKKISYTTPGIMDVLYYTPDSSMDDMKNMPKMTATHGFESVAFHEDYTDPDSFFFAAHAGLSTYYHDHNDGGSFGFDMMGVSWATDIGKNNYNSGVANNVLYRKRTEGHNTLTINNGTEYNQKAQSFAPLTDSKVNNAGGYAVYDLTPYYSKDANSVKRGFYIDENFNSLTVRDELDLNKNSEVYWFMHTKAQIEILDEKTALLSQKGKSIMLQLETDAESFELSDMAAEPLPSSPQGGSQDSNSAYRKVAIKLTGTGKMNLTVKMAPYKSNTINTAPISEWILPEETDGAKKEDFSCTIKVNGMTLSDSSVIPVFDENVIPDYEIIPNDSEKTVVIDGDDKELGGKVSVTVYNKDKTKSQQQRFTYSATSSELLAVFDRYSANSIKVTDEPEPANPGTNAIDGDLSTRWCTKTLESEGIIDFGQELDFDAFTASFWKGNERKYTFELYASADGVSYERIDKFTSTGTSEDYEVYKLSKSCRARYIKYVNLGNTSSNADFNNLTEFQLLKYKG